LASDKQRVFVEIARVLKPEGRVRIADIVAEGLPRWVRRNHAHHGSCIAGAATEQDYVAGLHSAGLRQVTLGGRYVYDREQIADLIAGGKTSFAETRRLADAVVGRLWSAYFSASKPPSNNKGMR
jgi:SAM-dependent methyltransferase